MFRLAFIVTALLAFQPATSIADEAPACTDKDLTRETKRQVSRWQDKPVWGVQADEQLAEIDEALVESEYSACDLAHVERARQKVAAKSTDPEIAIPVLKHFLENTTQETNEDWKYHVTQLSKQYRRTTNLEALLEHSLKYLAEVDETTKGILKTSSLRARLKLGQISEAKATLLTEFDQAPEELGLSDLQLLYAVALRTDDPVLIDRIWEVADAPYVRKHLSSKPLPLFEGDLLDHILARTFGVHYEPEIVRPPRPSYSDEAARSGIEGECEVFFDVSVTGSPKNIEVDCTHELFEWVSWKAIKDAKLSPYIIDGEAYEWPSVVYPLEYRLAP